MKAKEILFDSLRRLGVKHIFSLPGALTLSLTDMLNDVSDIQHVLVRTETCGANIAVGYSVASGSPGVCLFITGPGGANALGGVARSYVDSIPLVMLISESSRKDIGKGVMHEMSSNIFDDIVKWNVTIDRVERIPHILDKAFKIAASGRPGPVRVALPHDLTEVEVPYLSECEYSPERIETNISDAASKAASLLRGSERPLILAGWGVICAEATNELVRIAEALNSPVATTRHGKGAFPEDHPLSIGVTGVRKSASLLEIFSQADSVLAVGTSLSAVPTLMWKLPLSRLVHINVDLNHINRTYLAEIGIVADAKEGLSAILDCFDGSPKMAPKAWRPGIHDEVRKTFEDSIAHLLVPGKPPTIPSIIKSIDQCLASDAILSTDVGQGRTWALALYEARGSRRLIDQGPLSAMGGGFPMAIGAKIACPHKQVVSVTGDGAFLMSLQELATAVENNLSLPVVITNDQGYLTLKHHQDKRYGRRLGVSWNSPDYVGIARAFGARGVLIEDSRDFPEALQEALGVDLPTVIDVRIDPSHPAPHR